jgi:diketogulonate reductase-like aldo/keto reductase
MAALVKTLPMPAGEIPRIAYGTGTFWGHYKTGVSRDEVNPQLVEAIKSAISAGVRHIDCAEMYGSELSVGEGLRQALAGGGVSRSDLWVTSKAWNTSKGSAEELRAACQGSLSRLGLHYLDLYLLHSPFGADESELSAESTQLTWAAMEVLHAEGLVRNLGVSNHRVQDLQQIMATAHTQPAVNQIEFNPILLTPARELTRFCREHGIVIEAYSALASMVYDGAKGTALDAEVAAIADEIGRDSAAVLLRWNLHQGTVVISTSTKPHRVAEALRVFEFELSEAQQARIGAVCADVRPHVQFWTKSWSKV